MTVTLNPILQRLSECRPIPVMARGILERCLNPAQLDAWFGSVAEQQYTRTLLFSAVFDLMTQVVLRQQPSVNAAWQAAVETIGVSVTSVYNKLNGLETATIAGLVSFSSAHVLELIRALGETRPPLLAGVPVKVLDGNHLEGRQHRLQETRASTAAPLPGQALVVFDPQHEVITTLFPEPDAYTQERALLGRVLATIQPGELWIADRNFCTKGWWWELHQRQAMGLLREHDQMRFEPLEALRKIGRVDNGTVYEQPVRLPPVADDVAGLEVRRIVIRLDQPTRNGDDTISLLTTVPADLADAGTLARLYKTRWTIEKAFLHLTTQLRCEINTLGYPSAALFGFAVAAVAFNSLAVGKAALRCVHGIAAIDEEVSGYYLAIEMANTADSFTAVLDPEDWSELRTLSVTAFAEWLRTLAARADLRKYRKHTRGPKKPAAKRIHNPRRPHVSVARLLAKREKSRAP
jgi:Transposase DDE domain